MIIQEPVQAAIRHALDHYAYNDAIFLAERLYAEVASDDALYLLATCYYRSGETFSAYSILHSKDSRTPQCKFLLAKCCHDLKKYTEAELALTGCSIGKTKTPDEIATEFGESGAFAVQLLADLLSKTDKCIRSAEAYKKSLLLNPFLWSSYESLINLGERPDPVKIFSLASLEDFSTCQGSSSLLSLVNKTPILGPNSKTTQSESKKEVSSQASGKPSNHLGDKNSVLPIHSPLALIRSNNAPLEPVLEIWTPDNNRWFPLPIPITPSSQNQNNPPTSPALSGKAAKSKPVNTRLANRNLFNGTPTGTACPRFGVLPIGEASGGYHASKPCTENYSPASNVVTPNSPALINTQSNERAPTKKEKATNQRRGQGIIPPKFQIFTQSSNNSSNLLTQQTSVPEDPPSNPGSGLNNVRRSSRLFSSSNSVKENNKTSTKTGRYATNKTSVSKRSKSSTKSTSNNIKNSSTSKESQMNELNKSHSLDSKLLDNRNAISVSEAALSMQKASAEGLMVLLRELGRARLHLGQFHCAKAMEVLNELPLCHQRTGWVLVQQAKAHFELAEYEQAVSLFQEVRHHEPHRLQGMEYYSTALWHLQMEVALSALAQELTETAKDAPQTWCAAGNCFSLQKEHETAIKFLQRAVQVDSEFAYAYTLLGHEHVITEEMDRAMACFRNAIRIDPRHYNAWYGVGMIYYKQEKFHLAEVHFKRALSMHPQSSVLMCHIGVVQHALKKTEASLSTLNRATAMDPKNPLCKFHRASIYFSLDRHQEALKELEELKELVPRESLVFFLIGKVHKKLGNTHLALMNFSWAMDLDPKGANNQIKEAIDKRYTNEEEEVLSSSNQEPAVEDISNVSLAGSHLDPESSSHDSSVMDPDEIRHQAMESDDSF